MENFLLNHIATVATFFLTIAYIPQIVTTYKTKDVSSIDPKFWYLINIALTCLVINAAVIYVKFGTWGYLVTEILNEGLAFVMLIMVIKYRKKS